eukprot:1392151-Amorphochlora_amoeboformis.AAC.1
MEIGKKEDERDRYDEKRRRVLTTVGHIRFAAAGKWAQCARLCRFAQSYDEDQIILRVLVRGPLSRRLGLRLGLRVWVRVRVRLRLRLK